MKDDDLDWGDDLFGGDIDFNDDFDFDPYKNKGLISGVVSGFLGGLVEHSVGSSAAITNNLRRVLPGSFSTFFEKAEYYRTIKNELVQEFKEENYQNVRSLQNIAKSLGRRIDNENSAIKRKLNAFGEDDFSSWEKYKPGEDESLVLEDDTHANFGEDVNRLIDVHQASAATSTNALLDMHAQVGGNVVAAVKAGNAGLLGIETGMRDLLNYQRNVQYKMDKTKIEIAAKNYILDARFYKFSEKANRKIIEELKKVVINSGKSDFEKTSLIEQTKAQARNKIVSVVGTRVGGFLGKVRSQLTSSKRKELYEKSGNGLNLLEEMLAGEGGGGLGAMGEGLGSLLAMGFVESLPGMLAQGPLRDLFNRGFSGLSDKNQSRLRSGYSRLTGYGHVASYLSTSGGGLINRYAENWQDLETQQFDNYEDYVDYKRSRQEKPISRALFRLTNTTGNLAKEGINRFMTGMAGNRAKGTQYTLNKRDSANLTSVAQWREINNITLVDVIPGLLTKIYESQEKMRTGNDAFRAPVFSYTRGEFVDRNIAAKIVKNDIFAHGEFSNAAAQAKNIVSQLDKDNVLTNQQISDLAIRIVKDADQEKGFNPYAYLGAIEGLDPKLNQLVNELVKQRFGISENDNEREGLQRILTGEKGGELSSISALMDELKKAVPNVAARIASNRDAGNEGSMRESGIIETKHGVDRVNTDLIFDRLMEYLIDPTNEELRGDFIDTLETNAGPTRSVGRGGNTRIVNKTHLGGLNESIASLSETIKEQFNKLDFSRLDFSQIHFDLEGMPDKFDTLNKTADEQKSLLKTISECVCRTAEGWGNKTDSEKQKIQQEEKEGKKTLLERIKAFSPKGFFNHSIEALAGHSPLILTGLAAGLAGYAFKDPKTAALIAGGIGVGYAYSKLRDIGGGSEPSDDENILDEEGNVLLYASKLRNKDYYDAASKKVIQSWKDIKGAVYDAVTKSYTTLAQLTGRLFGPDNRKLFLSGLSKAKDAVRGLWNKLDISGAFGQVADYTKNAIYQQDVYVPGDDEPRLTRKGFKDKKYYCLDPNTKKPFVLTGWDKIKGPVYALGADNTLTQIITEGELAQGLMTSTGVKIDTLKNTLGWAKEKAGGLLSRFGGFAKEKVGLGVDKVNDLIRSDYTTIETRLDRIYYLLCDEFGKPVQPLSEGKTPSTQNNTEETSPHKAESIFGNAFKRRGKKAGASGPFDKGSEYPHKVRLNSFEDQENKEEERKRNAFYDDVHSIKENMDENNGKSDEPKKKKGLFGMLGSILGVGFDVFKKLFTNPLGLLGDAIGLGVGAILKSPLRLVKLGTLLFKGVLGIASPVYKLLRWGFGGLLSALGGGIANTLGGLLDNVLPGGRSKKSKTAKNNKVNNRRTKRKFRGKGLFGLMGAGLFGSQFLGGEPDEEDDDSDDERLPWETEEEEQGGIRDTVDSMQSAAINTEMAAGAMAGGAKAATKFTPGMSKALTASKYAGALKMAGGAAKLAGGVAGKAFLPLAALQAGLAFADSDRVGEIFDTNVINGTQRASHAITDFLDLGGLVSGVTQGVGNLLGFDTTSWDGAATRFLNSALDNKVVDFLGSIPSPLTLPFMMLKSLKSIETDLSSIQRKIRIAMYGITDTKAPLARIVENIERELLPFVRITEGRVVISKDAPVAKIVQSLSSVNTPEAAVWYKQRFEPIYKLWLSATELVGFGVGLQRLDKDETPVVIKVVNQVQSAVTQFDPFPYNICPVIAKDYPIMDRAATEAKLAELKKEMNKQFKEQGVDEQGNISDKVVIRTAEEVKNGVPESDSWFDQGKAWLNSKLTKLSTIGFEEPKEVVQIDTKDLIPGEGKDIDVLTLIRLAAYGDQKHDPVRVAAVLKLERYCEQFFVLKNGLMTFDKSPKEVLGLFKDTFMLYPAWFEKWEKWFTDRFLPVLKTWVRLVYDKKRKLPKDTWKTLSSGERCDVGHALVEVKVEAKGKPIPVWDVEESPFFGLQSGTDAVITKRWINDLDAKRSEQTLKDPTSDKSSSDKSGKPRFRMATEDEKYAMYHSGGNRTYNYNANAGLGQENKQQSNNETAKDIINQVNTGPAGNRNTTGNYNTSILPGPESGAYGNVESSGDANYKPDSSVKNGKLRISPREAKKTILNEFIKRGITDPRVLAFAIANAEVETGFTNTVEGFNYTVDALKDNWKIFRQNPDLANKYGRNDKTKQRANQTMIPRIAYANKNGNHGADDAEKYIGRGFTQITGRDNYTKASQATGVDLLSHPELAGTDPSIASATEYMYFKDRKVKNRNIITMLENGDYKAAAQAVGNPIIDKTTGRSSHDEKIQKTGKYLKELQSGELKTLLDELNAGKTADIEKDSTQTNEGGNTATSAGSTINGLDGTDKMNVPPRSEGEGGGSAITSPAVSASEAVPVNVESTQPQPAGPVKKEEIKSTESPQQTQATPATQKPVTPSEPVKPPVNTPASEKAKPVDEPKITAVYDAAVATAINQLTESLKTVLASPRKGVNVGSRTN